MYKKTLGFEVALVASCRVFFRLYYTKINDQINEHNAVVGFECEGSSVIGRQLLG